MGARDSLEGRKNKARRKAKRARRDFPSPPLSAPGSPRMGPGGCISLNFIRLLRVVITPSVVENDSKQSDEFQAMDACVCCEKKT